MSMIKRNKIIGLRFTLVQLIANYINLLKLELLLKVSASNRAHTFGPSDNTFLPDSNYMKK